MTPGPGPEPGPDVGLAQLAGCCSSCLEVMTHWPAEESTVTQKAYSGAQLAGKDVQKEEEVGRKRAGALRNPKPEEVMVAAG